MSGIFGILEFGGSDRWLAIEVSRLEAAVVEAREIFKRLGLGFWDSDEAEERSKSKKRAR